MSLARAAAFALGLAFLWGCGSAPVMSYRPVPVPAAKAVKTVKAQVGKPYRYGGKSPSEGFDCSGLVYYSYKAHGVSLPRTAREQFRLGRAIARDRLQAGDLVFFDIAGSPPSHVGTMVSSRAFIHAPSRGGRVRQESLEERYWQRAFYGARRLQ